MGFLSVDGFGRENTWLRSSPDCLGPDDIVGLVEGQLAGDELAQAHAHLGQCAACRRHVSDLIKASRESGPRSTELRPEKRGAFLSRGTAVGRYLVDGWIGEGAMGIVYAAYDPKLDRKIALKMVSTDSRPGPDARDRLEREARAMARLSHPNVVSVYDIGVHEGQLFIAMEFIDGVTLGSWLRRESRSLRSILDAFFQAGKGLAAAHAAGLVHRDFKPDNVLCDLHGRVCVTDFGLARAMPISTLVHANSAASNGEHLLTNRSETGTLAGTPAYMAPEQHAGKDADARSDQFSFCVALYEALNGMHPFSGETWAELAQNARQGKISEPASCKDVSKIALGAPELPLLGVPSCVHEALLRGLQVEPEQRFASMNDLLNALSKNASKRRWQAGLVLAAVATVAAGRFAYHHQHTESLRICKGAGNELSYVWDGARKAAIRDAFLAIDKPFAKDAWQGIERVLDTYAHDWTAARTDACEDTYVRAEQSPKVLDLRVSCLDARKKEMGALTEELTRADTQVVLKAVGAAQSLASLAPCSDTKTLLARRKISNDPAVQDVSNQVVRAKALRDVGKIREAL
ncbi:MAG TPA: serine/threonine-protein kinase, partial [Polyangiaceae bacterium]|nr:serine/threonine-protein kinase [Polyangiaceae bacterium]